MFRDDNFDLRAIINVSCCTRHTLAHHYTDPRQAHHYTDPRQAQHFTDPGWRASLVVVFCSAFNPSLTTTTTIHHHHPSPHVSNLSASLLRILGVACCSQCKKTAARTQVQRSEGQGSRGSVRGEVSSAQVKVRKRSISIWLAAFYVCIYLDFSIRQDHPRVSVSSKPGGKAPKTS